MQIKEIIEYNYSSPHQKSTATTRKENREFCIHSCKIKRETLKFQEPIQDYGFIDGINTCEQEINKKIEQEEKKEGQLSLEKKGGS
jgi:hypothetical protein